MGFEGKKVLKLKFEDPDLAGLEVVTRRPSIEQVLQMEDVGDGAAPLEMMRPVAELLCALLVGWNLENDGVAVPATADALLAQDFDVAQAIIKAWEENALKVAGPLEPSSSGGEPSVVASLPMEPLSPSLAS